MTYTAERFFVPVFFSGQSGWSSVGAGERWVTSSWSSPAGAGRVHLNILAFRETEPRPEVVEAIQDIGGVDVVAGPDAVRMAGWDATVFDVAGQRKDSSLEGYACTTQLARWNWESSGYPLVYNDAWEHGVPACYRSRVWVVTVDGSSITIIATPDDPDRFDELIGAAEALLGEAMIGN